MASIATAEGFLNSVGVATALGSYLDAYKNSSLIVDSLKYLGVGTVRASYTEFGDAAPILHAVADAGIKFDFLARSVDYNSGSKGLTDFVSNLKEFAQTHPGSVIAIEGVNEANLNNVSYAGLSGVEAAAQFQRDLYTAVKAEPALSSISVYNLSVGYNDLTAYSAIGDLSKYSDFGNAHIYTTTETTSDRQIEHSLDLASNPVDGKPVVVTETGHTTLDGWVGTGASDLAQAKLMLNNLFFAFEDGSAKTYLYELFDKPSAEVVSEKEGHFGIFNADGSPKIAATALHNLTNILSFGDKGNSVPPADTSFTLSNAPALTHSMVLQKAGGVYDVVVWADKVVWDASTQKDVANPVVNTTVDLGSVHGRIYVYDPLQGTDPIAVYNNAQQIVIPVSDHPIVIEVDATGPVVPTNISSDGNVTLTSTELVAQLGKLAESTGLEHISLSDTHELAVSSAPTMQYIVSKYGDVLSKVDGGYSFSVTSGQATWSTTAQYDAHGTLTLRTDYGLDNGVVIAKKITSTDGSSDNYKYGITGQTYVTEHYTINAQGVVTSLERLTANGLRVYAENKAADGSKTTIYYSSNGAKSAEYQFAADGTATTFNYGNNNSVIRQIVKQPNGDITTTTFDNSGAKTQVLAVSHLGDVETKNYDATGHLLNDTLKHADGSLVYTTYSATGAITTSQIKAADGSYDYYKYGITGQTYVTEHQTVNAQGVVMALERLTSSGLRVYAETKAADGGKTTIYYSSAGTKSSEYQFAADGTATTINYGNNNIVTRQIVKLANGDTTATAFNNIGVKTQVVSVSHLGDTDTKNYDATGHLLNETLKHADGSFVYTAYSSTGVITTSQIKAADGSSENYKYGITGQTYVTEHQTINAQGVITSMERLSTNGLRVYAENKAADGSKTTIYYSSAGTKSAEYQFAADGTATTINYGNNNIVTRQIVKLTNGDTTTTSYNNSGVKTQVVSVSHLGDVDTKNYDASGRLLNDTLKHADGSFVYTAYSSSGAVTTSQIKAADGSSENYKYGITGQTYVTEHQTINAQGVITALERLTTNGLRVYAESKAADGSKTTIYYSSAGTKSAEYEFAADGTATTLNYGNNNVLTRQIVKLASGDITTTTYNNGVKAQVVAVSHLGDTDTKNYDATGHLLNDTLKHADGSFVYSVYSSTGAITTSQIKAADGSSENYKYGITGQTYATEHQTLNAQGVITSLERLTADGLRVYAECKAADGSKTTIYYSSTGTKSSEYHFDADGTTTTLNYGNNNVLTRQIVKAANGDTSTTAYDSSGAKTQVVAVSHLGDTDTKNYDATGHLLNDTLKHADGSLVYTTYLSTGGISSSQIKAADGSYEYYKYGITGQTYATEHQTVNTQGIITSLERLTADGLRVYAESKAADGSKTTIYYLPSGDKSAEYHFASDGSRTAEIHLQDGSNQVRTEYYDASGALTKLDTATAAGEHTVYAYGNNQIMAGGSGDDTFYFRNTSGATMVFNGGHDTVYNFDFSGASQEHLHMAVSTVTDPSHAVLTQQGNDTLVTFDDHNSLLFKNTATTQVHWDVLS